MLITREPELEPALNNAALRRGVAPEPLVLDALRQLGLVGSPGLARKVSPNQARD